jgi:hypothetical protein
VTGVRSSKTERRSALLMIAVVTEREGTCRARCLFYLSQRREVVEINFARCSKSEISGSNYMVRARSVRTTAP